MERYYEIRKIAGLLAKLSVEALSSEETAQINLWRAASPDNEEFYRQVVSGEFICRKTRFVRDNDLQQAYVEFLGMAGTTSETAAPVNPAGSNPSPNAKKRRLLNRGAAVAAVVLVAVIAGMLMWRNRENIIERESIRPGEAKATLTTAAGRIYDITQTSYAEVIGSVAVELPSEAGKDSSGMHETLYNTITVPRGGEYYMVLDDGTGIYLNAESSIRIPMPYDRSVEVAGEAFFEVASDQERPFNVKTRYGTITVTGTSFNVRDYNDEVFMAATLVEGEIEFGEGEAHTPLSPGQQLRLNKANGAKQVRMVDVRQFVSWKDGRFIFEEERLEDLMHTLARWYDIEVVFETPSLKDMLFSGNIRKYDDFNSVIEMLSLVNKVKMESNGRQILIKAR